MNEELHPILGLDIEHIPFAVELYGISHCDGTYRQDRACGPIYVLEYVIQGTGTVKTPYETFHPSAGDSYLIRANEHHLYYSDPDDPWEKIWFNFYGDIVDPILNAYGFTKSTYFPGISTYEHLKNIHKILSAENTDIATLMNRCSVAFLELCQYLQFQNRLSRSKKLVRIPENIVRLKDYLNTHLDEHITMEKCTEITFLSVSQTDRSFRAAYGMPPYKYLNQRRIDTAKLLLRGSALSIKEIADQTGFSDKSFFSKYFKKKCGMTPTEFRNASLGNTDLTNMEEE